MGGFDVRESYALVKIRRFLANWVFTPLFVWALLIVITVFFPIVYLWMELYYREEKRILPKYEADRCAGVFKDWKDYK